MRQTKMTSWQHALVSDKPAPAVYIEIKDGSSVFPLYVYPKKQMFDKENNNGSGWPLSEKGRRPNLNPQFVNELAAKVGLTFMPEGTGDLTVTFGPEDIFAYAYAVLHNPTYRDRYSQFLKMDFPRLPLTSDVARFKALVGHGAELVKLHLMTHPALATLITTYPIQGDNIVAKSYPKYTEEDGRVWVNAKQYVAGVQPEVWEFQVGGYQVLHKWLKDRRERVLTYDDIRHYQRVVVALSETIRVMDAIDEAIPVWPMV